MADPVLFPPFDLPTPFPPPPDVTRLALCAPVDPSIGRVVVAASDVDRTGRSVVEESAGGPAVLRPDARAAGRSWPVRVLLALPTFGLLFGLVTGVIGLGVLLAIDPDDALRSSVGTSALLVSFAVGLISGVLFGTRVWSGQTRPTGFHLIVGELGAQWVCQDRGTVTSTAARYDGEEAWVHDMTRHVRAGQTMARTEALSVCDATGVVKRPTVVADGWMISAVMPVALRARAAARVPIVKERLGRGESVRFWFIGENPAPLVLHADRIEFRGTSLPRSGLTAEVVQGTVRFVHAAGVIWIASRGLGDAVVLLELLQGRPAI